MNIVHFANRGYMNLNAFGLPENKTSVKNEVVNRILYSTDGECYRTLKRLYGESIKDWLPKLSKNDYQGLLEKKKKKKNKWYNFDDVEALGVTFKQIKCPCDPFCYKIVALDRKVDPEHDQGKKTKYQVIFQNDWYGSGGGSIFKVETFVENYDRIISIFEEELPKAIETEININMGWVDNFMTLYYLLCGKSQTPNPCLTEVTTNPNWDSPQYSIVHQYKEFYE